PRASAAWPVSSSTWQSWWPWPVTSTTGPASPPSTAATSTTSGPARSHPKSPSRPASERLREAEDNNVSGVDKWINLTALWQIVVVGLLAGAGLPALFAVGLRFLNMTGGGRVAAAGAWAGRPPSRGGRARERGDGLRRQLDGARRGLRVLRHHPGRHRLRHLSHRL